MKREVPVVFLDCQFLEVKGKLLFVNGLPKGRIVDAEIFAGSGDMTEMVTDTGFRIRAHESIKFCVNPNSVTMGVPA